MIGAHFRVAGVATLLRDFDVERRATIDVSDLAEEFQDVFEA